MTHLKWFFVFIKLNLEEKNIDLIKMISLLIHAAKIDENYTEKEKSLIMNFIEMSSKKKLDKKEVAGIKLFLGSSTGKMLIDNKNSGRSATNAR